MDGPNQFATNPPHVRFDLASGSESKRFGRARRVSSGNRRTSGLLFPVEIRAYIRAAPAASLAGESRLQIGQPDIIGPSIAADRCVVAAMIIGTVDQETANASGAHFCEGDLLASRFGHGS